MTKEKFELCKSFLNETLSYKCDHLEITVLENNIEVVMKCHPNQMGGSFLDEIPPMFSYYIYNKNDVITLRFC